MKIEVIGFVEAVERLADRVGYRLTYEGGGSSVQRERNTRSRLLEANRRAAEFYAAQLRTPEAAPAVQFLTTRGFDVTAATTFGCGYAPAGWDTLTKHLLAAGFSRRRADQGRVEQGGPARPDRPVPPPAAVADPRPRRRRRRLRGAPAVRRRRHRGQVPQHAPTRRSTTRRKVLFGLDLAKREIAKRRQVVVVEGYTDVMAMHLAGVPTAVASCGTAFGAEHIAVIRRLIGDDSFDLGEVIYTFDGDAAGQAAALKAFEGDQSFAAQTFVAIAPDGKDPCELRQAHGDTAVRDLVARREPLFEFAIRSMLRDHDLDSAEGRVAALQRTVPLVARIKREDLRDEYARRLAGWTSWDDIAMVVRRVRETAGAPAEPRPRAARRRPAPAAPRRGRPAAAPAARGAQGRAAGPRGRRAELRRAARAGVHPSRVRRRAPRGAGGRRGVRRPRRLGLAGGGAGASARRRPGRWSPSWRWSRWSCRGAPVDRRRPGRHRRGPLRRPASSPGCGWCWSRPRWPS